MYWSAFSPSSIAIFPNVKPINNWNYIVERTDQWFSFFHRKIERKQCSITPRTTLCSRTKRQLLSAVGIRATRPASSCSRSATTASSGSSFTQPPSRHSSPARTTSGPGSGLREEADKLEVDIATFKLCLEFK